MIHPEEVDTYDPNTGEKYSGGGILTSNDIFAIHNQATVFAQNQNGDDLISRMSEVDVESYVSYSNISMFGNLNAVGDQTDEDRENQAKREHVFDGTLKDKKMSDRKNHYRHVTAKAQKAAKKLRVNRKINFVREDKSKLLKKIAGDNAKKSLKMLNSRNIRKHNAQNSNKRSRIKLAQ